MGKLIIFDLDQTLVRPIPGIKVPNRLSEQVMILGVVGKCKQLRMQGHTLAIASNQGGVSLGLCTLQDAKDRVYTVAQEIGAAQWEMCIYHENAKPDLPTALLHNPSDGIVTRAFYRKPAPGMLLAIMLLCEFQPADTLFVGDMDTDRQAAANAGVRFEWAKDFFGWS